MVEETAGCAGELWGWRAPIEMLVGRAQGQMEGVAVDGEAGVELVVLLGPGEHRRSELGQAQSDAGVHQQGERCPATTEELIQPRRIPRLPLVENHQSHGRAFDGEAKEVDVHRLCLLYTSRCV